MSTRQETILSNFSTDFISKYKYCPLTNSVISSLINGTDVWRVLEAVLKQHEDMVKSDIADKIEQITMGPRPQYIVSTQEVIDKFRAGRVITTDLIQQCVEEGVSLAASATPIDQYGIFLNSMKLFKEKQNETKREEARGSF